LVVRGEWRWWVGDLAARYAKRATGGGCFGGLGDSFFGCRIIATACGKTEKSRAYAGCCNALNEMATRQATRRGCGIEFALLDF
jgi:hypothetical protein